MEIVNTYKQLIPAARFIGKKYGDADRVDGSYSFVWQQFVQNNWFDTILQAAGGKEACDSLYEDGNASLGFMRYKEGEPFQYWIGMFTPPNTEVPEGFDFIDLEQSYCGICWYLGQVPDIFAKEELAMHKLEEHGMTLKTDEQGAIWFFERYSPSRFHQADEHNRVTLDIGFYVNE